MFSNNIKSLDFNALSDSLRTFSPSIRKIEEVLKKAMSFERLDDSDLACLLSDAALGMREEVSRAAYAVSLQRHGRVIRFYAPIYVSNECNNHCAYCGFNSAKNIKRLTLSLDEVLKEAKEIKKMGIEHLLIVSGEDKEKLTVDHLCELSRELSLIFSSLSIEVAPMEKESYSRLFSSGIDGVICYQETYNPASYAKYHGPGPKRDMTKRLDTLDRAGSSGMRALGLGVLLGLDDYRTEAYFIAQHARYLEKKYWRSQISVSFPRIRACSTNFKAPFPVNDEKLLLLISAMRLFLPDANLLISTRESKDFREKSVFAGINQMSAGSKTSPLGYTSSASPGDSAFTEQFEIIDDRSPMEISKRLYELGYDPVFKDWDKGFRYE
jgi:2-iminoacetate synthase